MNSPIHAWLSADGSIAGRLVRRGAALEGRPMLPSYLSARSSKRPLFMDTAAWRTGRLTVGAFDDDKPGGPVDFIVVRGAPACG
jgi:hypothetical protein